MFGKHPRERGVYAVYQGRFLGEMHVLIEQDDEHYYFLGLPDMHKRTITKRLFDIALKEEAIKFVEKLPKQVYEVCEAQYNSLKDDTAIVNKYHEYKSQANSTE